MSDLKNIILKGETALSRAESVLILYLLVAELLLGLFTILLKVLVGLGLLEAATVQPLSALNRELSMGGLLWLAFLGGSLAVSRDRNIAIDLVRQFTRPERQRSIARLVNALAAFLSFVFFLVAMVFIVYKFRLDWPATGEVHTGWPRLAVLFRLVYPVMLAIICYKFVAATLDPARMEEAGRADGEALSEY